MMSFRLQEDVAQPVEQLTFNERVVGSIPTVFTCLSTQPVGAKSKKFFKSFGPSTVRKLSG